MMNAAILLVACLALAAAAGCASLPQTVQRTPTHAYTDTADTRLGRAIGPLAASNAGKTGVLRAAERPRCLRRTRAAGPRRRAQPRRAVLHLEPRHERRAAGAGAVGGSRARRARAHAAGRRQHAASLDDSLATLDAHPNIEVRLFNPFPNRSWRIADFATDFSRLNRRMHNKSFTADNQFAIVGGRNIGDEYLGADSAVEFADLDVVATGALVSDVSADFDAYWNSPPAYPASAIIARVPPEAATARPRGLGRAAPEPQGGRLSRRGARPAVRVAGARRHRAVRVGGGAPRERRSAEDREPARAQGPADAAASPACARARR